MTKYDEKSIELLLSEQGLRSKLRSSKKKYYVYVIYGGTLGPIYVGKGCKDRVFTHVRNAEHFLQNNPSLPYMKWITTGEVLHKTKLERLAAHLSYAPLRFRLETLTDDEDKAFNVEKKLIKALGMSKMGRGILANQVEGGYGKGPGTGRIATSECRLRISQALSGRVMTSSHRRNISSALKGRMIDLKVRKKMSASRRGTPASDDHKKAVSLGRLNSKNIPRVRVRIGRRVYASIKDAAASVNTNYQSFCYQLNAGTFGYKRIP
jgi:hypothetical protein